MRCRRPRLKRLAVGAAVMTVLALASACGGSGYCSAVDQNRAALDGFALTTQAFSAGADALAAVAREAPAGEVREAYEEAADAARAVVEAQEDSGVPLDQLDHEAIVEMPQPKVDALRAAYADFNDTRTKRRLIAEDAAESCNITLKSLDQAAD